MHSFLILGATGGIGSETARRLRTAGHADYLMARNQERLANLGAELDSPWQVVDARSVKAVSDAARHAAGILGGVDGIVSCVGSLLLKPAHHTSLEEWHEAIAANLTSAFAAVRAAYETMRSSGGSVVLLSSAAARIGLSHHEAVAAAKAGVIGLTKSAAASYASRRIRFNAIAPGLVQTSLTASIWKNPKSFETSRSMHAAGRLGEPKDVASLIHWLMQPENDWVTGQVFGVDGGLATLRSSRS